MVSDRQLRAWYDEMLNQSAKAEAASTRWQARKAHLTQWMEGHYNYTSGQAKRDKLSSDWDLQDAMDAWNWHRREANRLALLVQAEWAFRQAGLYIDLGADADASAAAWPEGLR